MRALLNQSYETYEITGPQMVLTMKLTTFAWNVYDGRRPKEVGFYIVLKDIDLTSVTGAGQVPGAEAGQRVPISPSLPGFRVSAPPLSPCFLTSS